MKEKKKTLSENVLLEAKNILKAYGPTVAVNEYCMKIFPGEVVGLLGGNGAGKSTLMRVISGVTTPDKGEIQFAGQTLDWHEFNPLHATRMGIRVVYQELSLCLNLKVYENFYIELSSMMKNNINWRNEAISIAKKSLDMVFPGNDIDVEARLDALSISQQQMVEIARAFSDPNLRLLILDEPTSSLPAEQTEQLMEQIIQTAKEKNVSFIFISHRLSEAIKLCDKIYMMQNGKNIWSGLVSETDETDLVKRMGSKISIEEIAKKHSKIKTKINENVQVDISDINTKALSGVSLAAKGGEILGITGLEGSGQRELLHHIFKHKNRGGKGVNIKGSVAYVTGDRKKEGIYPLWSILENLMMTKLSMGRLFKHINAKRAISDSMVWYDKLKIKSDGINAGITSLSGGNQQKVLIARALVAEADIIILDDPTRGVDVMTKHQLYEIFQEASEQGKLVIWYSSDDEELSICTRILVMRFGSVVGELSGKEINKANIVRTSFSSEDLKSKVKHIKPEKSSKKSSINMLFASGVALPLIVMILVYGFCGISTPAVFSWYGITLLLGSTAPLIFATISQMLIIGLGHIDLGVGAYMGLINVLAATLMFEHPALGWLFVIVALLLYSCMGLIIYYRRIPAIIITLGSSFIWKGLSLFLLDRPGGQAPQWLFNIFWNNSKVPFVLVIIVAFSVIAWWFHHSRYGTVIKGFGNNPQSMVRSGWSQPFAYWVTYLAAGIMAILGGLIMTGSTGAADANASASYQMLTIAAVVMGGGYLVGGIVTVPGAVFGAITLSLISALLGFLRVSTELTAAVQGLILIVILALRILSKDGKRRSL